MTSLSDRFSMICSFLTGDLRNRCTWTPCTLGQSNFSNNHPTSARDFITAIKSRPPPSSQIAHQLACFHPSIHQSKVTTHSSLSALKFTADALVSQDFSLLTVSRLPGKSPLVAHAIEEKSKSEERIRLAGLTLQTRRFRAS